ncbi:MAG: MFS transporter [Balneolaceae bacterium]
MSYLAFVLQERRVLSFGLSFTFFSSFGQTFVISLFVPFFLEAFSLTNAGFGAIFSVATLISAGTLPWLGRHIDRIPLQKYSFAVASGLLMAALVVMVSWHISVLFLGILLLRLSGRGLSCHTAETTMARLYNGERGKALSVSSLGYPLGEGLIPLAVAGLLTIIDWRTTWGLIALCIILVWMPIIYFLVNRDRNGRFDEQKKMDTVSAAHENYSLIFHDQRIWFLLPATVMSAFWVTGLFLYQVSIGGTLGWSPALIATAFTSFAIFRIMGAVAIGPLIDRFSARHLFPFFLIPMIAGFTLPIFFSGTWIAFLYMSLIGLTMGFGTNIKSALWAELFGTSMIGTVRSFFASFSVFTSALSPFLVGWLLDIGLSFTYVLFMGAMVSALATLLSLRIHPAFDPADG